LNPVPERLEVDESEATPEETRPTARAGGVSGRAVRNSRPIDEVLVVRFIGAHPGCSCGFPHVLAEEPIEYWEGMFDDQDREDDLRSVESLLVLVREHVTATGEVQLYPVWDGEEGSRRRA
jgi:hypothetical protein